MDENEWLADRFEEHRAHLRAVAYRMLGSSPRPTPFRTPGCA
jgi:DNA-directed RNA polymerase specialized sigma24 family protein